ncbi:hypothetical protein LSTR_LSTR000052 [Laodelphax striatellus]|uniref:Uncharacterized protein n=1 Tax=Laodelphax striatellus TaxID=195883 RepID=A0A482X784_LAOST|nr:hypothetical protein LSTR_LSTR000052 [Laodelphax striatellus]
MKTPSIAVMPDNYFVRGRSSSQIDALIPISQRNSPTAVHLFPSLCFIVAVPQIVKVTITTTNKCTPCRQLPQECNTAGYGRTTRKQRRNAIPNLCTTRGQVSTNHLYVNRWVRPDPSKAPLITYPEYANQRDKSEESNKNQQTLDGVISDQCHCFKRNGLQDECQIPKCMLNPGCKALPEPRCPNMYEERLREAKRACEEGRYGSPSSMYCPDY